MLDQAGLHFRAAFFRAIRSFFHTAGFLEVDTPIRQPYLIPEANIIPIAAGQQFLQSSPELCMKRLLASGCEKIFQLCPCFRGGERGRLHLEEFWMLEWYRLDCDYRDLMLDCRKLFVHLQDQLAVELGRLGWGTDGFFFTADLDQPWPRLTVAEAFSRFAPVSVDTALQEQRFEEVLVEYVEPHLGTDRPVFLCDYPVELGSLARRSTADPRTVERFELYLQGIELANGFSELTDPDEQRQRFAAESAVIRERYGRTHEMPERFLSALGDIGQAAGIALGVDRLLMLMMGYRELRRAVSFSPDDW